MVDLPKSQEVFEGDSLELTCGAVAVPTPEIVWIKAGATLPSKVILISCGVVF